MAKQENLEYDSLEFTLLKVEHDYEHDLNDSLVKDLNRVRVHGARHMERALCANVPIMSSNKSFIFITMRRL